MTTLTVTRAAQLPRVNLLPPEIEEAAKLGRLKRVLVLAVVGSLVLVALLFVWASRQVSSAQSDLTAAQATGTALQAEAAKYAEVPKVNAEVTAAETNLSTAMAPEIRWSFYLNDLSLTIPNGVRLTSFTATNAAAQAQAQAGSTLPVSASGVPGVGTVAFEGKATGSDAVVSFLRVLDKQKGYYEPYLSSFTREDGTTVGRVYTFSSTATVNMDALSQRYAQAGQ